MTRTAILIASLLGLCVSHAQAELLTSPTTEFGMVGEIDFSQFVGRPGTILLEGDSPAEIGELVNERVSIRPVSGQSAIGIIAGGPVSDHPLSGTYFLGPRGSWSYEERQGFLGIGGGDSSLAVLRVEFLDGPVASVGGLFNYSGNFVAATMRAIRSDGTVIGTHDIPASAPIGIGDGRNHGEFRGIASTMDEIFALEIEARFAVIDNIRFTRIVPEPSAAAALLIVVPLAAGYRRKNEPRRGSLWSSPESCTSLDERIGVSEWYSAGPP